MSRHRLNGMQRVIQVTWVLGSSLMTVSDVRNWSAGGCVADD
jgi:hypothetical protein